MDTGVSELLIRQTVQDIRHLSYKMRNGPTGLHHATQAGVTSHSYQTISETTSPLTCGHLILQTTIRLIITYWAK